ncbi:hypothetical protein F441_06918 [Phytophthora nicotianae CJ01A1]|uniref:Uncharacterized protein n=1 Tax=Phytophthora nicotianae CJ01A1 TaxID=1317063 RepID=W2X992_PHYNI|nr:hypothetical protein F441_06918 [Phytophthora nicotianae CJ01A1]
MHGSSVLNTDGSIPIDYGSDIEDVPHGGGRGRLLLGSSLRWPIQRPIHSLVRGERVVKIRALQVRSVRILEKSAP